jgi:hypothetical protein
MQACEQLSSTFGKKRSQSECGTFLALEVEVMEPHSFKDVHAQCLWNTKAATELSLVQCGVGPEVVAIELEVADLSVSGQIGRSTRHRLPPCLHRMVVLMKEGCRRNQDVTTIVNPRPTIYH